ncbi:bifunctional hydroxymethylpyrimidine kinase/phosphomethylpyrimidine kinase [Pedobacter sp. AW31-3R]|uniref:bifunctional hydroxymethylpyrimidine kinase/phosphomethylpyrimidine kinase n=1 Tax=Pedobacter sp. AW31-3R TaxID=3445781 RepID=UPI003FA17566
MIKSYTYPSVMTIAGSDSGGGAGIQADIKAIAALGCFATSAITAVTVQNTLGVTAIHSIPPIIVKGQIVAILTDIEPLAIKIGMVHTLELVETITAVLRLYPEIPVVLDPVMVATSGDKLIENNTVTGLITHLFPLSALVTPNLDEATILAGMPVHTLEDMKIAGRKILALGCKAVLLKGGHLEGNKLTSIYFEGDTMQEFHYDRIDTNNTHGSGCTLSSAIAACLAQGMALADAVYAAQEYVNEAIVQGSDVQTGNGNGPLNHFFNPQHLIKNELVG